MTYVVRRRKLADTWKQGLVPDSQYIYAMRSSWYPIGLIKIGFTTNPVGRISSYRGAIPNAQFIALVRVPDGKAVERRLLETYSRRREYGRE